METDDPVLRLYKTTGIFIRALAHFDLEEEMQTIKKNVSTLSQHGITTKEKLKNYFWTTQKDEQPKLIPNFKFRPSTLIKEGVPIAMFISGGNAIIINPTATTVFATHFYKKNVRSYDIAYTPRFFFPRPDGIKDNETQENLVKKLTEVEARRCGHAWDNYGRHHGAPLQYHNETLLHYGPDAIIGLVLGKNAFVDFKNMFEKLTGRNNIKCYRYHDSAGVLEAADFTSFPPEKYLDLPADYFHIINNASKIKKITCSLERYDPSPNSPVTYTFKSSLPYRGSEVTCYMKEGTPVLEINNLVTYKFKDLPSFILEYQCRQVRHCQALLEDPQIKAFLGVSVISLRIDYSIITKKRLLLAYDSLEHTLGPEALLNRIGYDTAKLKWALLKPSMRYECNVNISLPVLQALSVMTQVLQDLKKEFAPKRRRQL